jgi:chemotaxis methyl-accepting protein methylase
MDDDEREVERVVAALRASSGVDFGAYKSGTLGRRIRVRAAMAGCADLAAYRSLVEADASERVLLLHAVLVKTTSMYRDEAVFSALRASALPRLVADRAASGARTLRAWVPACSTGEEAYALAMCLREATDGGPVEPSVLASDVDRGALEHVPRGVYRRANASDVPPDLAARWLDDAGPQHVRVRDELRAAVKSSFHDLLDPNFAAPPAAVVAAFDVISCRNVLIYLRPEAQERVLLRFLKASTERGLLVLGHAEAPPASLRAEFIPLGPGLPLYWMHGAPAQRPAR